MNDIINQTPFKSFPNRVYAYKAAAIIILLYFFGGIVISIIQFAFFTDYTGKIFSIYSQGILQIILIFLPTIYFAKRALLPYNILLRKNSTLNIQQVLAGVIGIIAFQGFVTGVMILQEKLVPDSLLTNYKEIESFVEKMYMTLLGGSGYLDLTRALVIGCLIPAIAEETLFRGFLQTSLEQEYKPLKAILITSLIFSILHINPIGIVPLICIGIYLGYVAYVTNNLVLPMLIHFINNAIAVIILYSPELSEIEDKSSDITFASAVYLLFSGLSIVLMCCYVLMKYSNEKQFKT